VGPFTACMTRQTMYVQPNIEACSFNHCYSGKAIGITYSECVFVALVIQHAMRMLHIVICGLPGSTIFFTLSQKRRRLRGKKNYWAQNVCSFTLQQRFSNFFQVGTTFISQNVLRTTFISQNVLRTTFISQNVLRTTFISHNVLRTILHLGLSNSLGLP